MQWKNEIMMKVHFHRDARLICYIGFGVRWLVNLEVTKVNDGTRRKKTSRG